MKTLTIAQAHQIVEFLHKQNLPEVFQKMQAHCGTTIEISTFRQEYTSGNYRHDLFQRIQTYIEGLVHTSFEALPTADYDLFFSFSSKNKDEADALVIELRKCGLRVFYSGDDLKQSIGQDYFEKINSALENSQHFVLLCTPEAMQSAWVKKEYGIFYTNCHIEAEEERRFFVLQGKQYEDKLLPMMLKNLQRPTLPELLATLGKTNPQDQIIKELQASQTRLQTALDLAHEELARLQARNEVLSKQEKQAKVALEVEREKAHELEARLQKPSKENEELRRLLEEKEKEIVELKKGIGDLMGKLEKEKKHTKAYIDLVSKIEIEERQLYKKTKELEKNIFDGQEFYNQLEQKYNSLQEAYNLLKNLPKSIAKLSISEVKIPNVAESITEVVIGKWFKKNGDIVKVEEALCEIETEKASQELYAGQDGILQITVKEGETIAVGVVIAKIIFSEKQDGVVRTLKQNKIVEVKLTNMGAESVTEAVVGVWLKKDGDFVQKGESICDLETDKASQELPAEESGILRIVAETGVTLPVGTLLCYIE